jgi:hypothetical protein
MVAAIGGTIEPSGVVGFLLQTAAVGTCVGTLVSYRRRRDNPDFDTFPIITRWCVGGLLGGVMYLLYVAIF